MKRSSNLVLLWNHPCETGQAFQNLVKPGGGGDGGGRIPSPRAIFTSWRQMTMKFGGVILYQKLYQEIIKHSVTSWLWRHYHDILYFWLPSGGKKVEKLNFFVFHPICLKCGIGGNFDMLITKRRPKLILANELSKKMQFSTDFSQTYTKHSSIIALPWQQWMSHGTGLYSEWKLISI